MLQTVMLHVNSRLAVAFASPAAWQQCAHWLNTCSSLSAHQGQQHPAQPEGTVNFVRSLATHAPYAAWAIDHVGSSKPSSRLQMHGAACWHSLHTTSAMAAHNDTSNSSHEAATDPGDNLYGAEGSGSTTSSSTSSRIARPHTTHATLPQEPHTTWPGDPDMPILRTRIVLELMHSADQKEKALTRHQLHQLAAQQHPELIKSINHLKKILNILKSRKLVATKPHDPAHPTVPPYLYYVTPQGRHMLKQEPKPSWLYRQAHEGLAQHAPQHAQGRTIDAEAYGLMDEGQPATCVPSCHPGN